MRPTHQTKMPNRISSSVARALLTIAPVVALAQPVPAQTFKVLYNFSYRPGGWNPYGTLLVHDGILYGTTIAGGSANSNIDCLGEGQSCGAVFQFDLKSGTETLLHSFAGPPSEGALPYAGLSRDEAGNLYGTTYYGGFENDGTVFRIDSTGNFSTLHSFIGADGFALWAGVVPDSSGNLYGETLGKSGSQEGLLFKLDPEGVLTTQPSASAVLGTLRLKNNLQLYGAGSGGGAYNAGTVFTVNAETGKLTVLYNFTGGADGGNPTGSLTADSAGNLYGTATCGGAVSCSGGNGVVFMLNLRTGQETVLHTFGGYPDGVQPQGQLALDSSGNLYGATAFGGENVCNEGTIGCGTVFKLTPPGPDGGAWTETVLHNFDGGDGWGPLGGVTLDSQGHLYGVAFWGGTNNNTGTLFEVTP
jgi:uncharacterized repeat protein (TIGR03803 family)